MTLTELLVELDYHPNQLTLLCAAEIRRQHARILELEAQLAEASVTQFVLESSIGKLDRIIDMLQKCKQGEAAVLRSLLCECLKVIDVLRADAESDEELCLLENLLDKVERVTRP